MKVSALVLTLNEETNIERCLAALSWCDDVVVVDSLSTDRTVEIASSRGARVFQRKFDNFAGQRNFALDTVPFLHSWILHLDADEVVTPELRAELASLPDDIPFVGYRMAGRLMMGEKWLRYSGMYPVYQVRLTRVGEFRFRQVGHGQREASDEYAIGTLREPYLHYGFSKGLNDWFERHNRYSSDEARELGLRRSATTDVIRGILSANSTNRRRALKDLSYRLPFRPFFRFLYMYVIRLGFLDGAEGYRYAQMMATYERMIDLKIAAAEREGRP